MKSKGDSHARALYAEVDGEDRLGRARKFTVQTRPVVDAKHRSYLNGKTYAPNGDRERARRLANQARKLVSA
jgi:hypothetical protein